MLRVPSLSALLVAAGLAVAMPAAPALALDNHSLVLACMKATGVQGNYDYAPEMDIPHMRALQGGSAAGAARLNACIRQSIDVYRPAYTSTLSAQTNDVTRGRVLIAMANELNSESAPCQVTLTGGTGYDTCHRPW